MLVACATILIGLRPVSGSTLLNVFFCTVLKLLNGRLSVVMWCFTPSHTVVWECCKDDQQSQWEMPYFGVCQHQKPWVDFQKKLYGWLCRGPHPRCKYWGQSVQRGRVCACVKLSPSGVYFFFLRFHAPRYRSARWPVNSSNDVLWWRSRLFYGFVNKKILRFYPKMWKIALHPMVMLKSYNFGIVEDTYKLFAPNRFF